MTDPRPGRAKKSAYQIAWSTPLLGNPDWIGHYDCEATDALKAIAETRLYMRETHGYERGQFVIHEVYKI